MPSDTDKKIAAISWEEIVMEAMVALTNGRDTVSVPAEEMYRWIEGTEYLTNFGRATDPSWNNGRYPGYRASLQLRWQRMEKQGLLVRETTGFYRLAQPQAMPIMTVWQEMVKVDQEVGTPAVQKVQAKRIQRSQRLRDLLINYYESHCQICGDNAPFRIPTEVAQRDYVEVHHVNGLAESVALQAEGLLVGLRVNGLGNLTVLCPHHHATVHHHYPQYEFHRQTLAWRHHKGGTLALQRLTKEHADLLRTAVSD